MPVLIALFHDILITAGVYSLTGKEVSSGTVAAFLTILGYSLYDTIIVFDRIRENMPRMPRAAFSQIVNRSMSEVLTRSLATSFTTLMAVTSLLIFGGATLQDFAFAMLVGIASGTYSSIFIASPVLTAWKEREPGFARRRQRIAELSGSVPPFADESSWPSSATTPTTKPRVDGADEAEAASRASHDRGRSPAADPEGGRGPAPVRFLERREDSSRRTLGRAPREKRRATGPPPGPAQAREEPLMGRRVALLVWFTMGIALWHFTVFLPDRFWQGIVGAFIGSVIGALVFGTIVEVVTGKSLGNTDLATALIAIPGVAIGLGVVWFIGVREERQQQTFGGGSRAASGERRAVCEEGRFFVRPLAQPWWVAESIKAYRAEPYSYADARVLAAELELSEPVAITLVRRGYRTPARRGPSSRPTSRMTLSSGRWPRSPSGPRRDRRRRTDHSPRRLRRLRRLRHDDHGQRPDGPWRRLRLADPGQDQRRLRTLRQQT